MNGNDAGGDPDSYQGFEQGPIRPPSEAHSLLVRVTRNCPWNRCTFCPVYKGTKFSRRSVEHVKRDIDAVHQHVETLREAADQHGRLSRERLAAIFGKVESHEVLAFNAALDWFVVGRMKSVFVQDANSLVLKTPELVDILTHLKKRFPSVQRVTSYARAQTMAVKKDDDLKAIAKAGLDRVHIGMESGSDQVLEMVRKGVTKEQHITAGRKVKRAGMELSEYVMPGLGGRRLSDVHARQTADALNQIDPDFIRIRTLAIPSSAPLAEEWRAGRFDKCTDLEMARELLTFIENLEGITSTVVSDHILNLFQDVRGKLPRDKQGMLEVIRTFLALDPKEQRLYQVGRRAGIFVCVGHMQVPHRRAEAQTICEQLNITPENVDQIADRMVTRYI